LAATSRIPFARFCQCSGLLQTWAIATETGLRTQILRSPNLDQKSLNSLLIGDELCGEAARNLL
jgi:hypothetical protein